MPNGKQFIEDLWHPMMSLGHNDSAFDDNAQWICAGVPSELPGAHNKLNCRRRHWNAITMRVSSSLVHDDMLLTLEIVVATNDLRHCVYMIRGRWSFYKLIKRPCILPSRWALDATLWIRTVGIKKATSTCSEIRKYCELDSIKGHVREDTSCATWAFIH